MPKVAVAPAPTAPAATPAPKAGWGWKQRASQFYCLLILLGFPVFSVPCQKGTCTSPLDVVVTYGYAKKILPEDWTRGMLYPAALMLNAEVLMSDDPSSFRLPEWDGILSRWNLTADIIENDSRAGSLSLIPNLLSIFEANNPYGVSWEFVGACVVCLIGALLSFAGPNKISFWGIIIVLWFIFIEGGRREEVYAQPMFALVVVCSLAWINFKDIFTLPREGVTPETAAKPKVESKKE
ncbi:unnamed protein product [Calypogeia fissa]